MSTSITLLEARLSALHLYFWLNTWQNLKRWDCIKLIVTEFHFITLKKIYDPEWKYSASIDDLSSDNASEITDNADSYKIRH